MEITAEEWKAAYLRMAARVKESSDLHEELRKKYKDLLERWEKDQEDKSRWPPEPVNPLEERVSRLEKVVASMTESLNADFDARQNEINNQFAHEDAKRAAQQAFSEEVVAGGRRVSIRREDLNSIMGTLHNTNAKVYTTDWFNRLLAVLDSNV